MAHPDPAALTPRLVPVAGIPVLDLDVPGVVELIASSVGEPGAARVALDFHVGALNARDEPGFVAAMQQGDFVYADGMSVVLLARLAGARTIERAVTTDIGLPVLRAAAARLGRPVRVAVIGGPPGLAARAGEVIEREANAHLVHASSGFEQDYRPVLARLTEQRPDVLVLGLGMPREALWAAEHRNALPGILVLTCGGWLGFLVGDERRAPLWMQRFGLEWAYRVRQQPARLAARYLVGLLTTVRLAVATLRANRAPQGSTGSGLPAVSTRVAPERDE